LITAEENVEKIILFREESGMVAYTCNQSKRRHWQGDRELEASLRLYT
jgi:hypothetical protein